MDKGRNILERQIHDWQNHAKSLISSKKSVKARPEPFITISRSYAGGSGTIAKAVAKELGFTVYDREILDMIASSCKVQDLLIESLDEHHLSQIDDFFENLFNSPHISETTYLKHLTKVVLALISKGKTVIVGRGGNLIAPFSWGLQVRIVSPLQDRITRLISRNKISEKAAKKLILKEDRMRSEFIRRNFHKDINDPLIYDLMINASEFSVEQITAIIVKAYKERLKI